MNLYEQQDFNESEEEITLTQEEYEERKEMCKMLLVRAKAAAKLAENPDFKMIVMEEYFTKEPQRLGSLMASGKLNKANFDACVEDLRSIGHLRTFLQGFIEQGNIAKDELDQLEIARMEMVQNQNPIS